MEDSADIFRNAVCEHRSYSLSKECLPNVFLRSQKGPRTNIRGHAVRAYSSLDKRDRRKRVITSHIKDRASDRDQVDHALKSFRKSDHTLSVKNVLRRKVPRLMTASARVPFLFDYRTIRTGQIISQDNP